ncbi:hypothetical protein KAR91_44285 [Candidatus Pacearchaeota archaeon]|nr:hypothetical protein [Candidatus Pacearchaeota archaeon]
MPIPKSKEKLLWEFHDNGMTPYKAAQKAKVDYKTAVKYFKIFTDLIDRESEKLQTEIPDQIETKAKTFLSSLVPGRV